MSNDRTQTLAESIEQQLANTPRPGDRVVLLASLIEQFTQRFVGFAQLPGVRHGALTGSDLAATVALGLRRLRREVGSDPVHGVLVVTIDEMERKTALFLADGDPDLLDVIERDASRLRELAHSTIGDVT